MSHTKSILKNVTYGRDLARAGASGIRAEHRVALHGQPFSSALTEVARNSLKMAALGACIGLFHSYMTKRRGHLSRAIGYGSLGGTMESLRGLAGTTVALLPSSLVQQ